MGVAISDGLFFVLVMGSVGLLMSGVSDLGFFCAELAHAIWGDDE